MEFDPNRAARVDIKRRRLREETKINRRSVRSWEEEADVDDNEQKINRYRRQNQNDKE